MMMSQVDHINVELGLGIEGWVGPVAIWRVHVTSGIHSNPIWDKQNICDRTRGGKRWKVWISDRCTTLSTSLYQLSYWLREALLTDSHNEWGEKREKSLLGKNPLDFFFIVFHQGTSIWQNFPSFVFFGPTCMHCISSSGFSWLSASSTLTNLLPGNAEACSKVRTLAQSLTSAQQAKRDTSRQCYRRDSLDSGTCKFYKWEAAGSSKFLSTFT